MSKRWRAGPGCRVELGAIPEFIAHDETGFIASTNTGLVEALGCIDRIDRATCRRHAEARFSMQRMAADHESVYRKVIAYWPTSGYQG